MKHPNDIVRPHFRGFGLHLAAVVGTVALGCAGTAEAQFVSAPHDTRAVPAPVKAEGEGVHRIASGVAEGVERVDRAVRPDARDAEALNGLREGQTVVVHDRRQGAQGGGEPADLVGSEGLTATEGTVTDINRKRAEIRIRFDDRTTETFRVARQDVGIEGADASHVLIDYPNAAGEKVGHTFVRVSKKASPRTR